MASEARNPRLPIRVFRKLVPAVLAVLGFLSASSARAQSNRSASDPSATSTGSDDIWGVHHFTRPAEQPAWKERARADELTRTAERAAEQNDCATAVPRFAEAYRLRGKAAALHGAVECAKRQQRWRDAYSLMQHLIENHGASNSASAELEEIASHTASLEISVTPADAEVKIDGMSRAGPATRLAPGTYTIRISKPGFYPVQQIVELAAGAEEVVTIVLKRAPPEGATAHFDQKQVIDYCRLASGTATDVHKLQRLVLFAVGGMDVTHQPEGELDEQGRPAAGVEHRIFERVRAHDHLRDVFATTFPSDHFYTVHTRAPGPATLAGRPRVSAAEMIGAASIDPFAGYSIACADWVAIPRVTGKQASWHKVKKRGGGAAAATYEAWTVDLAYDLQVDVYRRRGKDWILVTTLAGSSRDEPGSPAAPPAAVAEKAARTGDTPLVSAAPHPACEVVLPGSAAKLADAFRSCGDSLWPVQELATQVLAAHAETGVHETSLPQDDPVEPSDAPPPDELEANDTEALSPADFARLERVSGPDPTVGLQEVTRGATGGSTAAVSPVAEAAETAERKCAAAVQSAADLSGGLDEAPTLSADDQPEATLGFAACGGIPVQFAPGKPVPVGTKQSQSEYCADVKDDVNLGAAGMRAAAVCAIRVAAERVALKLRADARRLEGWKSFDALQQRPAGKNRGFGLALGEEEGYGRGDLFVVEVPTPDGTMQRVGFGRIVEAGPGGDAGASHPSHFKFRSGTLHAEARLRAWKQAGVRVGPHARYAFRYVKGDLDAAFPGGVGLTLGYAGTSFVPIADEFWFRLDVGYLLGAAEFGYGDFSLYADLLGEAHFYGSNRLAWVVTAGVGGTRLRGTYDEGNASGGTETTAVSGFGAAAILGGGLDVALHPDWNLQGLVKVRQSVHPFEPEGELNGETVRLDASFLGAIELAFTAAYTF